MEQVLEPQQNPSTSAVRQVPSVRFERIYTDASESYLHLLEYGSAILARRADDVRTVAQPPGTLHTNMYKFTTRYMIFKERMSASYLQNIVRQFPRVVAG